MAVDIKREKSRVPVIPKAVKQRRLVAAIDFGTTFSGYAYSLRSDFDNDPLKVHANEWGAGTVLRGSHKTSTCVLFDKHGEFDSFGFDAETKYHKLTMESDHWDWFFFSRFKMSLYIAGLKRNTELKDDKAKPMMAIDVFSKSIEYLKDHMIKESETKRDGVPSRDIFWVLTVPAIWDDSAKQFMREAAIHAGISTDNLTLALEPEAASLFCRYLPTQRVEGLVDSEIRCFTKGEKYMILDAGGGTVDITVHEVKQDNNIRELYKANGGEWGGTKVDASFVDLLREIIGADVLEIIQMRYKDDFIALQKEFELRKRTITPETKGTVDFTLAQSVKDSYKEMNKFNLGEGNKIVSSLRDKVSFSGRIKISSDVIKELFDEVCGKITYHLSEQFGQIRKYDIKKILMVGGLSQSPMLQHAIKTSFPDKRIIIPEEAELAVMKGAVIFGHNPNLIVSRVCKHTYGIETLKQFEPALDPESKRVVQDGFILCKNAFSKHAEVGQEYEVAEKFGEHEYVPLESSQTEMMIAVYRSPRRYPMHVDERNCEKIGEMTIKLNESKDGEVRPVLVQFVLGDTELRVITKEKNTNTEANAKFDCL